MVLEEDEDTAVQIAAIQGLTDILIVYGDEVIIKPGCGFGCVKVEVDRGLQHVYIPHKRAAAEHGV